MKLILLAAAVLAGAAGALWLWWAGRRQRRRLIEALPAAAARVAQALDEHRYSAAQRQLDSLLKDLPDAPALAGLKVRLAEALAEHGGDASQAERSCHLLQDAAAALKEGRLPGPEELSHLEALPGPKAKDLCARIMAKQEQLRLLEFERVQDARHAEETGQTLERLSALAEAGQLRAALAQAQAAAQSNGSRALAVFVNALECRAQAAQTIADVVSKRLSRADTASAKKALAELLAVDADHELGRRLHDAMGIQQQEPLRVLRPQKAGKPVVLMHRDVFVVGRDPGKGADLIVAEERVSRAHLKFSIKEDHLHAEDLGTANGSFIGQGRFTQVTARDGDLIKLAGAVPIVVRVSYEWETMAGAGAVRDPARARITIPGRPTDRKHGQVVGVFLELPGCVVLWGRMPVSLGPDGWQVNRRAKTELCYKDGVLLFGRNGLFRPVFPGESVEDGGAAYILAA